MLIHQTEVGMRKMLSREEKLVKRREFIASDSFTEATSTSLLLLNENIQAMIRVIELEGILIRELQDGIWAEKYHMTERHRWETSHLAYVDAMSKLMMCIESLFIVMYSVRHQYRRLPTYLTRYAMSQVDVTLNLLSREREVKAALWRILGLPNPKHLGLGRADRKVVWQVLSLSVNAAFTALQKIKDFYVDHLVTYGKFKHGLSMLLGQASDGQSPIDSLIHAFDRTEDRPGGFVMEMGNRFEEGFEWFNTLQLVPYNKAAFEVMSRVMYDVRELVFVITNNHLTWAENCGLDYLPARREGDKAYPLVYGGPVPETTQQAYQQIFLRVAENMTLATRTVTFNFTLKRDPPEPLERLSKGLPLTIWVNPKRETGPYLTRVPTIT